MIAHTNAGVTYVQRPETPGPIRGRVILSLRRIRDPTARRDELRILRLRSQARFAQDDTCTPRKFRVLHRLNVILSLRRIRDPSARHDKLRILRLRSQARFAQDDISLRRIRNPSARRDELRILRLRSQARFAQDDTALERTM